MDQYFQCLTRRLSGKSHEHTLQPTLRVWYNFYDPFENIGVYPLQYPESKTKKTRLLADWKDTIKEEDSYKRNLQEISEHQLSAIKPLEKFFLEKFPQRRLKRAGLKPISSAISDRNIKMVKSKPAIGRNPTQIKTEILKQSVKKKDSHIPLQNIEPPVAEMEKQTIKPYNTPIYKKPAGQTYFKVIFAKSGKPWTAPGQTFRRAEEKIENIERSMDSNGNHYITITRVEPITPHSFTMTDPPRSKRRSATKTGKKNRLSIGNLVVDVVPVMETAHKKSSSRVRKKTIQKQFKNSLNRQTANLFFGLGQM